MFLKADFVAVVHVAGNELLIRRHACRGGMAGTPHAANDNGTIAKNFVVLESRQHIPECKQYQNDIDDNTSATVDGRKFATATTCPARAAHAANIANTTVDSKPLAPKYNVGTRSLQSALRNLRVSHDPPAVTVFTIQH